MLLKKARPETGKGLEVDRLNFLFDGVLAIVLTLLVLELKLPEGLANDRIVPELVANTPKFAAFAICFNAASVGWALSYLMHSIMVRSKFSHMIFTLLALMAAATVPFASAIMGNYPDSPWGYVPYMLVATSFTGLMALDVLVNGRKFSSPKLDPRLFTTFTVSLGLGVCVGLAGCALAFWSPRTAFWIVVLGSALIWVEYYYVAAWIGRELLRIESIENAEQRTPGTVPATALSQPDTICPEAERQGAGQ